MILKEHDSAEKIPLGIGSKSTDTEIHIVYPEAAELSIIGSISCTHMLPLNSDDPCTCC